MPRRVPFSRGFTLVELLTVIAVIAVLIAMLLPALNRARQSAQIITCASNERQILQAFHMYASAHRGWLPYQAVGVRDWSGALNEELRNPRVFRCPVDENMRRPPLDAAAYRSYAVNSGKWVNAYVRSLGYKTPWPMDRFDRPVQLLQVPIQVFIIGENHGHDAWPGSGWFADGGALVGLAEFEGLDSFAWDLHRKDGVNYGFSDGHVEYRSKKDVDQYRSDTDYGGDIRDPWKWK